MAYTGVTKQQVLAGFISDLEVVLQNFPSGELPQFLAENLQNALAQKGHTDAGNVIDPDKDYPDLRF